MYLLLLHFNLFLSVGETEMKIETNIRGHPVPALWVYTPTQACSMKDSGLSQVCPRRQLVESHNRVTWHGFSFLRIHRLAHKIGDAWWLSLLGRCAFEINNHFQDLIPTLPPFRKLPEEPLSVKKV